MRRVAATLGLILLAPVAYLLVTGELTMTEAATRAGFVFGAVVVMTYVGRIGLEMVARSVEATAPKRRAGDMPAAAEE